MSSPRDIVVFGDDWGHYPSTIQHMAGVWSRTHRILWIGSLGLRKPRPSVYDALRVLRKGSDMILGRPGLERPAPGQTGSAQPDAGQSAGIHRVYPAILPFHDLPAVRRINCRSLRRLLHQRMAELGFREPIVITVSPIVGDLIGTLGESSSHYLCLDDWTQFPNAFVCLELLERELLGKVDGCFAVSEFLLRTRPAASGENHHLPQGVDVDHFAHPGPVPPEVASLRKPVVGFFGMLASFTDQDLLAEAARRHPNLTFALLGRRLVDTRRLEGLANLHYLGEVPFERLPAYAQVFDVGLIPFKLNQLTLAANPLKLLEYLALGIRVVATDLPELRRFQPHVLIGRDHEEFIRQIGVAVDNLSREDKAALRGVAAAYSWERISRSFLDEVERIDRRKFAARRTVEEPDAGSRAAARTP